jgi:GNAT superfamily N-acetyltransferase
MSTQLEIRKATVNDLPLIYKLVKDLVVYQGLLHQFSATEELLKEALFGKRSYAEVVIGYIDNEPAAYAIYFFSFSTFTGKPGLYLEDIYVCPDFRGHGIGHQLMTYLAQQAMDANCSHLELRVKDSNTSAIQFYENLGAKTSGGWISYSFDENVLQQINN